MHLTDKPALEAQFASAIVVSRDNTGAGFYTNFTVTHDSSMAVRGERLRNGPSGTIEGLKYGMGFILWLTDGFANCLEGYSYDESTVEIDFEKASFEVAANDCGR
jgi:hypothetical protein